MRQLIDQMKERWITVDGSKIRYLESGEGKGGLPLLLLPSSAGRCMEYREIIPLLADAFHCLAIDYPGFGRSDPAKKIEGSLDLARFVRLWMSEVGLSQVHLAGFSMGGWVALYMAMLCPKNIAKLILIATSAGTISEAPILNPSGMNKREILRTFYFRPEVRERMAREAVSLEEKEEILRSSHALMKLIAHGKLVPQLSEELYKIRMPTLIIGAKEDQAIPMIYQERLSQSILGSRLVVFPETGHAIVAERPVELAREIRAFLM